MGKDDSNWIWITERCMFLKYFILVLIKFVLLYISLSENSYLNSRHDTANIEQFNMTKNYWLHTLSVQCIYTTDIVLNSSNVYYFMYTFSRSIG